MTQLAGSRTQRRIQPFIVLAIIVLAILVYAAPLLADRLAVHEWGTFTALQDENGRAIGGINSDDEPVPRFVHRVADGLVGGQHWGGKGLAPGCHPDVTLRLETPVVYFYPPPGTEKLTLDCEVKFHGGWLTEYYPHACAIAPGIGPGRKFGPLRSTTTGSLAWKKLEVGTAGKVRPTASHVWNAPRQVAAATVTARGGESEKYLFYRGVGHLDAPLRVQRTADKTLRIQSAFGKLPGNEIPKVEASWLVSILPDGKTAFRVLEPFTADEERTVVATVEAHFDDTQYSAENLTRLRAAMHHALVADGLFADEASALLDTWESSYFKSPGTRLFFLVPEAWTDRVLPLEISVPADITRVMIGRIELITPRERRLLREIATRPASNPGSRASRQANGNRAEPPADYKAYRKLGRFRNALLLDAARQEGALDAFIANYKLHGYRTGEEGRLSRRSP